jgi:hypothetical protein
LVASLLGLPNLLGVEDPFLGLLAEEIREELIRARAELMECGMLEMCIDGSVTLNMVVFSMMQAIISARRTFIGSFSSNQGQSCHRLIHQSPDLLVEQECLPDGQITLTAIRDQETLLNRLKGFYWLIDTVAGTGSAITLVESDFSAARQIADKTGKTACRDFLVRGGTAPATADALAAVLAEPTGTGSISTLYREAKEIRYGDSLAWIIGVAGTWCMQPVSQIPPTVRLFPASGTEIRARINQIVYSGIA